MLILPRQKIVFSHIPRTGGNTLCRAIKKVDDSAVVLTGELTHLPIWKIRQVLPGYSVFSIVRNPVVILESHFLFCKWIMSHKIVNLIPYAETCSYKTFKEHIERSLPILCRFGGFKLTYTDSQTKLFDFTSLNLHESIQEYLGINYTVENDDYDYIHAPIADSDDINLIQKYCWKDYE